MSTLSEHLPGHREEESASIELVIDGHARDLGGFTVRRVLPSMGRRLIGPFIFFDHLGPVQLPAGDGLDVRSHPHIALATVTFLFEGEIIHRDSVGSLQTVKRGDVNWMTAGRGIAHSERSPADARVDGARLHGIQSWVALPLEHEEIAPSFAHHPSSTLPVIHRDGAVLDVIAGTAYGARSPVAVLAPTLYVHARLDADAKLPIDDEHEERAVYVVEGSIRCDDRVFHAGTMLVLRPKASVIVEACEAARLMIIGGAHLAGERHIWWNFVSSSKERIEQAKDDWSHDRFARVLGDDVERIPLPS
jgi:redox-sensitive bicupin YhaK (pirin superfamily)